MDASLSEVEQGRSYAALGLDRPAVLKTFSTLLRLTAHANPRFHSENLILATHEASGSFPRWVSANLDNLVTRAASSSERWQSGFLDKNTSLLDVANSRTGDRDSFSILGRYPAKVIRCNPGQNWTRKPVYTLDADDAIAMGASKVTADSLRYVAWEPVMAMMGVVAIHNALHAGLQLSAAAAARIAEVPHAAPDIKPAAKIFGDRDLDGRVARLAHRPDFKELVRRAVELIEKKTP